MNKPATLIIGGDGLIGRALHQALQGSVCTSRRPQAPNYLDLQEPDSLSALQVDGYQIAFFCAACSKYADIAANIAKSEQINVYSTLRLCERLKKAGCSVVFLSSQAVHDGQQPFRQETDPVSPCSDYGRQKYAVEASLMATGMAKIVRLTKVLSAEMPLLVQWRHRLACGLGIAPFVDLQLSPVSLQFAVAGLLKIALQDSDGIFHLSGAGAISYAELACRLAQRWGYAGELIRPEPAQQLAYAPAYPALGMVRTTLLTGIAPQSLDGCIAELTHA